MSDSINIIGIVGTGAMGRGIAQVAAEAGLRVKLHDNREGAVDEARRFIGALWARGVEKQRFDQAYAETLEKRLEEALELDDMSDCDLVIEAIAEQIKAKQQLFRQLETVISSRTILATNTSSLSVSEVASACDYPERVIGFHFFNPVPLMKIVEVIPGLRTSPAVVEATEALGQRFGHFTARTTDTPGFLVNHAGRAFGTEALRILDEGVADPMTIDRLLTDQGGFRMGAFALFDLIGLDVSHAVMESVYHQYYQEPRFRPSVLTRQRVSAGLLGRKNGEGFYRYQQGQRQVSEESAAPQVSPMPVWISGEDTEARRLLGDLVEAAGWPLERGDTPSETALCLLTPYGEDATDSALRQHLDPARCVAIDMLAGLDTRRCLMSNPATRLDIRDAAHALLAADGTPVSTIEDSGGFVLQRVVACIVNVGADIAQQQIAEPATIDRAVELGLGYPKGPLAMGEHYGARRILTILENMQTATGDPRYRPSPWLRRRAHLGLSLTTSSVQSPSTMEHHHA
ncbi:3-hydroxyacyl-CoA dehydrogenase [Halomonas elongata]|uniref:3-hydroxyacyl-CoA dehydrogenase n=1 Tax=Halomonas elongata TaxID=2746 RepID=UPI00255AA035|nr:3-hydroxyacyl-CoA dehydrogenase [Halomonas elongata]MDL4861007.1 3-hydroxyacyl-CoA dehydrogenase [Halomonas elongata]